MKILFFIDGLKSGGKERRLVELIKGISSDDRLNMELVLTSKEIHYQDIFLTHIKIHYLIRVKKRDPKIFYSFYKIAKEYQPDIIHVWSNLVALYAIPAKWVLNIPMINNQIGDVPISKPSGILNKFLTFPFSNWIVANSIAGLQAYDAPKHKSSVIYNGFDFNRISNLKDPLSVKKAFKIETRYLVGMIASFSILKDYKTYIEAALIVLSQRKDITFICVGTGNDQKFREMVEPKYIENILFLGGQSDVESIMNACDIGVLSTYTEGISNALLEFCALGKPVITTNGGGNGELVSDGKTGFLIPQKSPEILANKILLLINDQKLSTGMGIAGNRRIKDHFSIEHMIHNFNLLYNKYDAIL